MSPSEEEGSYVGINHAFVETYCSYYSRESDDGDGTKYKVFSCQSNADNNRSYVINNFAYEGNLGNLGGQTQLLRIRIIQLLNEYYGDWKWVGDPTAKIKVVSHSNGGLIITKALIDDSLYWDDGNVYYENWWNPPSNTYWPSLQGSGFKLSDHIDQVITIDTPFEGSPWADKNGKPTQLAYTLFNSTAGASEFLAVLPQFAFVQAFLKMKWTKVIHALGVVTYAGFVVTFNFSHAEIDVVYDLAVGGSDTPLIRDFAKDGTVITSLKGRKHPTFSDGKQIPYVNHIGTMDNLAIGYNIVSVATLVPAVYHTVMGCAFWYAPVKSIAEFARAGISYWSLASSIKSAKWCRNSDFIVSKESQDMRSVFPDSKREIKRSKDFFHTEQIYRLGNAVPEWVSGESDVSITNAIGILQQGENSYEILPQIRETLIDHKYCTWDGCSSSPETVTHYNQNIVRFNGCNPSTATEMQWPKVIDDTVHISDIVTGKPNTIVGKVTDYYMNSANLKLQVNTEPA